ncbi:MAG TPA: hypothetical protein VE111_00280 [Bradyrhizobium sp.]|nr:hypothetical protein [Bradyrhizobium sp.]
MARKPKENKAIPGQIGGGHRRIACVMDITLPEGPGGTLESVTKAAKGGVEGTRQATNQVADHDLAG